jgi:WD40 repeat protein
MLAVVEAVIQLTREPVPAVPVPDPLPARPAMPTGPLDDEREKLGRHELTPTEQSKLLAVLRDALNHPDQHDEATELLRNLATRDDVTKAVHDACTAILETEPTPSTTVTAKTEPVATIPIRSLIEGRTAPILTGHTSAVDGCAVAPDGIWIVSASHDKTLRLWNPDTGKTIRTLTGHTGPVSGCAVAPDGTWIVSASGDKTLRLWNPDTGKTIRTLTGHTGWVYGCVVGSDSTWIVSASGDKTLRLWEPDTGLTIRTLTGHTGPVTGCAVAPDGTWIVSASGDKTLRLWDPETGKTIRTLTGHTGSVYGCAIAPDGAYIVSASHDKTLRVWQ